MKDESYSEFCIPSIFLIDTVHMIKNDIILIHDINGGFLDILMYNTVHIATCLTGTSEHCSRFKKVFVGKPCTENLPVMEEADHIHHTILFISSVYTYC